MSFLAGHRRGGKSPQVYPIPPGAGGSTGNIPPLMRQRFIDGDTSQAGLTGSVAAPFKTIAQFMASRTNASIADATANYVGWVMPALAGYVENVAFPPYASTELRADSLSSVNGTIINDNVTWPNIAGAHAASGGAAICLHNVSVNGTFTVTDDVGAPGSEVVFGGDETAFVGVSIGAFVSSACTKLGAALFYNATITSIDAGATADSALVILDGCTVNGTVTARTVEMFDCNSTATAITALTTAIFRDTIFTAAAVLTVTTTSASFDGSSWMSFLGAGGTRAAGTAVLVVGGFDGAAVEGAALTGASTDVSLNGTGATAGYTGENSGNHYTTSNGTPTTVTLKTGGGELKGDTICITKTDLGANALAVKNNAAATIATIPANERGSVVARFDGADWVFDQGGSLAA